MKMKKKKNEMVGEDDAKKNGSGGPLWRLQRERGEWWRLAYRRRFESFSSSARAEKTLDEKKKKKIIYIYI